MLLTVVTYLLLLGFLIIFIFPPSKPTHPPNGGQAVAVPSPEITCEGDLPREVLKQFRDAPTVEERRSY